MKRITALALTAALFVPLLGCGDEEPYCGDGIVDRMEECDDGNKRDSDQCLSTCLVATCGDGIVQEGVEECDDGNKDNTDACLNTCKLATCGDGFLRQGVERCDDGNTSDGDSCSSSCTLTSCGDGKVQQGEECDDGNLSDADACLTTCVKAACGDGFVQDKTEQCDDGNKDDHDACLNTCKLSACGDGIVRKGVEACDDGNKVETDGCTSLCRLTSCGDGVRQGGEECDDGNANDTDGCLSTCLRATCGDGFVQQGAELCDDGNRVDDDGCTNDCKLPGCGDGIRQDSEECDDGNASFTDACLGTCAKATCGDGYVWSRKEQCDDGNAFDDDGCLSTCVKAACGDGHRWAGVEGCDDGNASNLDGCLNTCVPARCGDRFVWSEVEDCDDGNTDNTDGCLINCRAYDPCAAFAITKVDPAVACHSNVPTSVTLTGAGFLQVNGVDPTVTWDGAPVTVSLSGCTPVSGVFENINACTTMVVPVPAGTGIGNYTIAVTNAVTKPCTVTANFSVGPTPTVTSVVPNEICENTAGNFTINGTGFTPTTVVTFSSTATGAVSPLSTTYVSSTELSVSFGATQLKPGLYDVIVSNGPGCSSTLKDAVTVYKNPTVYFVDPEIIWEKISVLSTIYLSGINGGGVSYVGIRPAGTTQPLTELKPVYYDTSMPGRAQALIPANLTPGFYDLVVKDNKTCEGKLADAFEVTDDLTLDLDAIDPPFGKQGERTPVNLYGSESLPAGKVGFANGVRVYLSSGGTATALSSVGFLNSGTITGVVPGLTAGTYDVIAVNPTGEVGVIQNGFRVTVDQPPLIDEIAPGSIANSLNETVILYGSGFKTGVQVSLLCRDPSGNKSTVTTTVNSVSSTVVNLTVPSGMTTYTICVVRALNTDGAYGDYSSLGITGAAENLSAFTADTSMNTARRALSAVTGRPTRSSRYLYAIGGDTGTEAGALSSVETVSVDAYGDLASSWRTLDQALPAARTLAGAQVLGRFIYLVGGNDGSGPVSTVYRAEILDPAHAPEIYDLYIETATSGGVGPGLWYYRVSAVMEATDPDNPGGESLPSDPIPVKIPSSLGANVEITLYWKAVSGAASYRVYRSATPGLVTGQETLLATVTAPAVTYKDTGSSTTAGKTTRVLSDLGVWHSAGTLNKAREGLGVAMGKDPTTAGKYYLYALLGRTTGQTLPLTYEYLPITMASDGGQTLGSFTEHTSNTVTQGRWWLAGFKLDQVGSTRVTPGDNFIYAGPGRPATNMTQMIKALDAAKVQAGGQLTAWIDIGVSDEWAGYGATAAANQVFIIGGRQGLVSNLSKSSQICGGVINCGGSNPDEPPYLKGWNAGISLTTPRLLMGTTLESAHIFIIGGESTTGATSTVESTVW